MALNDAGDDEFDNELQDEDTFDAHSPPGTEVLGMAIARDYGSGSYAEDGRLEIPEGDVVMNGESLLGEIQAPFESFMLEDARMGTDIGSAAEHGFSEIGSAAEHGFSEIGSAAMYGPTEIGSAAEHGFSEIGSAAEHGFSEIGSAAEHGFSEIGSAAEHGFSEIGSAAMYGPTEIGAGLASEDGASEIGVAVAKTIQKARDNRQPPPPMKVVDVDAPLSDSLWDDALTDVIMGAAVVCGGVDAFPLTTKYMQRCGAGMPPRVVRVDTEESYKQLRQSMSPELTELRAKLEAHIADPYAHERASDLSDDLSDDMSDIVEIGAAAQAAEEGKRVEMVMPSHYDGLVEAWLEGDSVCASIALPSEDGTARIATSVEPLHKSIAEMSKHAAEAEVPASAVVGYLPSMGCVLGAGTVMKELAASAKDLVKRPEIKSGQPFMVRIEPKVNPALCALVMLVMACRTGDKQACAEWTQLAKLSPAPVKQAMSEALELAKAVG